MYDDVLVATDDSKAVEVAVDHAVDLAATTDATLHAVYVVDAPAYSVFPEAELGTVEENLEEVGRQAVAEVEDRAREAGVEATTEIRRGHPDEELLAYADEEDVDLIVMGSRGKSGLERVLLGSVSEKVVRNADRPVLIERSG